jgi:hypothetical protein
MALPWYTERRSSLYGLTDSMSGAPTLAGTCPAPFLPTHHPYAAVNFSTCKLPRPCSACHKS